jgi:hypothetical protein
VFAAALNEALSKQAAPGPEEEAPSPSTAATMPILSPGAQGEFKGEFDLPAIAGLDENRQLKKMAFVELSGYVQEPRVRGLGEGACLPSESRAALKALSQPPAR